VNAILDHWKGAEHKALEISVDGGQQFSLSRRTQNNRSFLLMEN